MNFFCTKNKPRIIRIEEVNNVKKISIEEFKSNENTNFKQSKKVKIFGIETNDDNISYNEDKEEVEENIINKDQYYSDYCRLYIKAGDGGNGLFSIIKGHLFDQGNI